MTSYRGVYEITFQPQVDSKADLISKFTTEKHSINDGSA